MKAKLVKDHPTKWECIQYPTFPKGSIVCKMAENEDEHFLNWYACTIEGRTTFVPLTFVEDEKLNRDYNPTELVAKSGDIVTVVEIVNAWLLVTNEKGKTGWIPAEVVVSI